MKTLIGRCVVALAFLIAVTSAHSLAAYDTAKQELIIELLKITKYDRVISQVADAVGNQLVAAVKNKNPEIGASVLGQVNQATREEFVKLGPEIMRFQSDFLYRHFTEEELRTVVDFYRTPAGQKTMSVMPKLVQEQMIWIGPIVQKLKSDLVSKLQKRLAEQGYQL